MHLLRKKPYGEVPSLYIIFPTTFSPGTAELSLLMHRHILESWQISSSKILVVPDPGWRLLKGDISGDKFHWEGPWFGCIHCRLSFLSSERRRAQLLGKLQTSFMFLGVNEIDYRVIKWSYKDDSIISLFFQQVLYTQATQPLLSWLFLRWSVTKNEAFSLLWTHGDSTRGMKQNVLRVPELLTFSLAWITNSSAGTLALIRFSIDGKNLQTLCLVIKTYKYQTQLKIC